MSCGSRKPDTFITRPSSSARSSVSPAACRRRAGLDAKKFDLATRTAGSGHAGPGGKLDGEQALAAGEPPRELKPPGSEILVDCPALEAAGISANAAGKFRAEKLPLDEALRQLLEPLDLSWRAVGPNALQITSQKALAARMEVEFYPAASCWEANRRTC